ncbi:MAG: hypothetical protein ABIZ81_11755 [Opitutaceae bacterium]
MQPAPSSRDLSGEERKNSHDHAMPFMAAIPPERLSVAGQKGGRCEIAGDGNVATVDRLLGSGDVAKRVVAPFDEEARLDGEMIRRAEALSVKLGVGEETVVMTNRS